MYPLTGDPTALALAGGHAVRQQPFAPWPVFAPDEIDAVVAVLRTGKVNYWTGEVCRRFEQAFAEATGCAHAIALANGTVALELALLALGIGEGDEVIVPSRTFIASASCVVARGARPVMADVDPISQNLTPETIAAALTPRTRAIVAVHLAGWPCEMAAIMAFAEAHDLKVIEDCAQAHGARYHGRPVGSLGHAAAFSFCQDKILTTGGEGGMLTTNDPAVWARAWRYKDHGKSLETLRQAGQPAQVAFRWLHESFGTNWRLTEIQAAIGERILPKLDGWVATRRRNAALLSAQLERLPGLRVTRPPAAVAHAYYKYYAFVEPGALRAGWSRDRLVEAIRAEGIPCFTGSCSEVYLEEAFPPAWRPAERLPVARALGEQALMFLVHPTLGEAEMIDTARAVAKVMGVAGR